MLTAAIAGAGMAVSAAVSVVSGAHSQNVSNAALAKSKGTDERAKTETKSVVLGLAPSVTTLGETLGQTDRRVNETERQASDTVSSIDVPLIHPVDQAGSVNKDLVDKVAMAKQQVANADVELNRRLGQAASDARNIGLVSEVGEQAASIRGEIQAEAVRVKLNTEMLHQEMRHIQDRLSRGMEKNVHASVARVASGRN